MTKSNASVKYISASEFSNLNSEEKIMKMAEELTVPEGKDQNLVLEAIFSKPEKPAVKKTIQFRRYFQAAAAIIILLLGIYSVTVIYSNQRIRTGFGSQTQITLPDGSLVSLNSGSKLVWNEKKFSNNRLVTLSGEAYFDVKKGDDFIINTKNGTIEILGTKLNVFSRENNFWVSCISGKVRVSANNQQQTITPGELVKLSEGSLIITTSEDIDKTISWKSGLFHFEETELNVIFDELERQFNVSIEWKGDGKRKATIDFSNKNLNEALDIVCIPMELSYEIQNKKKITITDKK